MIYSDDENAVRESEQEDAEAYEGNMPLLLNRLKMINF